MAQWVIPVTVDVWVEAETLKEAMDEISIHPPYRDVLGSTASYISAGVSKFGEAKVVTERPIWADQR